MILKGFRGFGKFWEILMSFGCFFFVNKYCMIVWFWNVLDVF